MIAVDFSVVAASADDGGSGLAMMDDAPSLALFVALVIAVSVASAIVLPIVLRRLPLRHAIPVLALVGPGLAFVGSLFGMGAMTLSGHDIWYVLLVAVSTGVASMVVGLRVARPMARDLDRVSTTVESVASGDRGARSGVDSGGEVGLLAAAVDELSRSLARAEAERAAAEDERRSVVSALSHDLRTPLASLLVSVDALEDEIGDPGAHIRAMRGNVLALESLVGDLFLLARADAGSLQLELEMLDLAELVDEAVEAVTPVASVRDVAIVAELHGPILVEGDYVALGRVLRNLLDNAVRHSPSTGLVSVIGSCHSGEAWLKILDEGAGFAESFLPQAFERFTQADGARSRPGGAGLGLAIARTLILAHGGAIEIQAGPGGQVHLGLPTAYDVVGEGSVRELHSHEDW